MNTYNFFNFQYYWAKSKLGYFLLLLPFSIPPFSMLHRCAIRPECSCTDRLELARHT